MLLETSTRPQGTIKNTLKGVPIMKKTIPTLHFDNTERKALTIEIKPD